MYATKGYSFHLSSEYSILTSLVNKLSLDNNKHIPYTSMYVCTWHAQSNLFNCSFSVLTNKWRLNTETEGESTKVIKCPR